ncbi:MAG: FGGY family carbohydrate kinase, partial [Lachnospiraceae bacterium]|nr:FGGY family carbohydrate kinase [Lachnospiraceae bacterium]
MSEKNYILAVDQSTSGTKALLFDRTGALVARKDLPHRQIINEIGWVEHDPMEIYRNTIQVLQDVVTESGVPKEEIAGLGISNQRETAMVWNRETGLPVYNAVVWQCARGAALCERLEQEGHAAVVKAATGLNLSPYFSAAKLAWVFHWLKEQNQAGDAKESLEKTLCAGTMDSWLVYKLTKGERFQTDYSNASRTQLFNIHTLSWDEELCCLFGVPMESLATVTDSNGDYGSTDLEGFFQEPIPIRGVFGDSHGALYGQGCHKVGMIKTTYGTGSSVMMNI